MIELLKGLFDNEEEAITVFQEYKKFGCKTCKISSIGSCSGEEEATSCWIQFCKEAGIIRKGVFDELMEYVEKIKKITTSAENDAEILISDDNVVLKQLILAYKAEAENKSKEK